jgi:hypothetical protein
VDLVCYCCIKSNDILQYTVLSNEIGAKPFSLNRGTLTFSSSLKIKTVCIGVVNLILLMILMFLFSDSNIRVHSSYFLS